MDDLIRASALLTNTDYEDDGIDENITSDDSGDDENEEDADMNMDGWEN